MKKLVVFLCLLATPAFADGPTDEELAADVKQHLIQLQEAIKALEGRGWIVLINHPNGDWWDSLQVETTRRYHIEIYRQPPTVYLSK